MLCSMPNRPVVGLTRVGSRLGKNSPYYRQLLVNHGAEKPLACGAAAICNQALHSRQLALSGSVIEGRRVQRSRIDSRISEQPIQHGQVPILGSETHGIVVPCSCIAARPSPEDLGNLHVVSRPCSARLWL